MFLNTSESCLTCTTPDLQLYSTSSEAQVEDALLVALNECSDMAPCLMVA